MKDWEGYRIWDRFNSEASTIGSNRSPKAGEVFVHVAPSEAVNGVVQSKPKRFVRRKAEGQVETTLPWFRD